MHRFRGFRTGTRYLFSCEKSAMDGWSLSRFIRLRSNWSPLGIRQSLRSWRLLHSCCRNLRLA